MHLIFIDLEKVYDTVPLQRLFETLERISRYKKCYIFSTIREIYWVLGKCPAKL
jgi:hypothetical protein